MLLYNELLDFDDQSLQRRLGPFLECHNHSRPSDDRVRDLIAKLIRTELTDLSAANDQNRARVNPPLLEICDSTYKNIIKASDS